MTLALPEEAFGKAQAESHGFLHSVESGAAVDGPGMRFVFFMAGCQFRCLYCHNPDTWKLHNGTHVGVPDMLAKVGKYASFLKFAGGVTFSGGEPMMQAEFVGATARAIKKRWGLHIALDTQGFLHDKIADDWFDPIDLVMLDIKHVDPVRYKELTAQELQPTLDFAERLVGLGKLMRIRYVLVPGWTDNPKDIVKMADLVASYGDAVELVEVLPFHQLGTAKWDKLGLEYKLRGTRTPTNHETESARNIFRSRGLEVT